MASSSGGENRWNHEVFLSFSGADTRSTFTGHLHHELKSKGINVFIDNKLERGEVITSQLLKVIEESRISIVVLSEKYASSSFCLDELIKIIECRVSKEQKVIPVFYHVDPTDVEEQKGRFGQEFDKIVAQLISVRAFSLFRIFLPMMRQRINNEEITANIKKVEKWRSALTEAARLSGWHLEDGNHEATTIQNIVKMVVKQLSIIPSHVTEHYVGLASHIDYILKRLSLESNDVRVLGLYGMGGIGKTTLANALYTRCVMQFAFEGSCFLLNVRENSNKYGLAKIQEDLFSKILGEKMDLKGNFMEGMELIKQRVGSKKVLVVIDDVDHFDQVEKLVGELEWFGRGSRIIITTRDLHLLKYHVGVIVYEVRRLSDDEAMRLLSWHAFKKDQPSEVYKDLSSRVVEYAGGHPLALKVLGSYLYGKSVLAWQNELKKLKRCPKDDIIKVLKISYDGLDNEEKVIFLDIALLFRRRYKNKVIELLDGCGFGAYIGVERLIEKSLLYVDNIGRMEMHDLLEEMATQIALKEAPRLCIWQREEIPNLFSKVKNPESVEGILFDFDGKEEEALNLSQFTNLRTLVIKKGCFTKLPSLPNNIRCLEWNKCSLQSIPFGFLPAELAFLDMSWSRIMHVEKSLHENWKAKRFLNLTRLNFSFSNYLREITVDFSTIPNLEEMDFQWCSNLEKIDVTITNLKRLRELNFTQCNRLTSLPNLPTNVTHLFLSCSGIKEIPFCNGNLIELDASNCKNLLPNIDTSVLGDCPNLRNLPEAQISVVSSNPTSTVTDLSYDDFIHLPINTFKFIQIQKLYLNSCKYLVEIPWLPHTLRLLEARNCTSLVRFSQFQFDDFKGDFINCHEIIEKEKKSWREMVEKISMKRKEEFPSRKYNIVLPGNEIPEWFSYSFNSESICSPFLVRVRALKPNVIGIAFCAIFHEGMRPIKFSVNEITIMSSAMDVHTRLESGYIGLGSEHMWIGFFTGFDWPKLLEAEEILCTFDSPLSLKRVGVHFIYGN